MHAGALSLRGLVTPLPAPTALTLASVQVQVQRTLGAAARLCIPESSAERQQVCTRRCFPSLHTSPERRSGMCTHRPPRCLLKAVPVLLQSQLLARRDIYFLDSQSRKQQRAERDVYSAGCWAPPCSQLEVSWDSRSHLAPLHVIIANSLLGLNPQT